MENSYMNLVWLAFMHYKEVEKMSPMVVVIEGDVSLLELSLEASSVKHIMWGGGGGGGEQIFKMRLIKYVPPNNQSNHFT